MEMRRECAACGSTVGEIKSKGGQDCVFCQCGKFQYNAPKTETGRAVRSVSTTHEAIKPNQRYRILARANHCCELCHKSNCNLHLSHAVSVLDGHKLGLPDIVINSDENLLALCEECNLGQGRATLPIRLLAGMLMARTSGDAASA